jgi:hypothetical protein
MIAAPDVGADYSRYTVEGGDIVDADHPTFGYCDHTFDSDGLRRTRLQASFRAGSGTLSPVSNEIVVYRPGGAVQALAEVRAHLNCTSYRPSDTVEATSLRQVVAVKGSPPGSIAECNQLRYADKKTVWSCSTYLVRADVLSAVYTYGPTLAEAQRLAGIYVPVAASRLAAA